MVGERTCKVAPTRCTILGMKKKRSEKVRVGFQYGSSKVFPHLECVCVRLCAGVSEVRPPTTFNELGPQDECQLTLWRDTQHKFPAPTGKRAAGERQTAHVTDRKQQSEAAGIDF